MVHITSVIELQGEAHECWIPEVLGIVEILLDAVPESIHDLSELLVTLTFILVYLFVPSRALSFIELVLYGIVVKRSDRAYLVGLSG